MRLKILNPKINKKFGRKVAKKGLMKVPKCFIVFTCSIILTKVSIVISDQIDRSTLLLIVFFS